MNYYSKYLKYKNKYLLLKSSLNNIQTGGDTPFLNIKYHINIVKYYKLLTKKENKFKY